MRGARNKSHVLISVQQRFRISELVLLQHDLFYCIVLRGSEWGGGGRGRGSTCRLSVEISLLCRLSVKISLLCRLSVKIFGPVHTYPDIFESATFSFRIRLPSTRIRRIRQRIRKKINPLSRVEKNKSATNPITCGRVNPDIFKSDDVISVSSLSPNNKPIRGSQWGRGGEKVPLTVKCKSF